MNVNKQIVIAIALSLLAPMGAHAESVQEYLARGNSRNNSSGRYSRSEDNRGSRRGGFNLPQVFTGGGGGLGFPVGGGSSRATVNTNSSGFRVSGQVPSKIPILGGQRFDYVNQKSRAEARQEVKPNANPQDAQYRRDAEKTSRTEEENIQLRNQLVGLQQQNLELRERLDAIEAQGNRGDNKVIEELEGQLDDQDAEIRRLKKQLRERGVSLPPAPKSAGSSESTEPPTEEPVEARPELQVSPAKAVKATPKAAKTKK